MESVYWEGLPEQQHWGTIPTGLLAKSEGCKKTFLGGSVLGGRELVLPMTTHSEQSDIATECGRVILS